MKRQDTNRCMLFVCFLVLLLIYMVCKSSNREMAVAAITEYKLFISFEPPQFYVFNEGEVSNVAIDANDNIIYDVFIVQRTVPEVYKSFEAFKSGTPPTNHRQSTYEYEAGGYTEKGVARINNVTAQTIMNDVDPTVRRAQLVIDGSSYPIYIGWEIAVEIYARIEGAADDGTVVQEWAYTKQGQTATSGADMDTNRRPQAPKNVIVNISADSGALENAFDIMNMVRVTSAIAPTTSPYMNFIRGEAGIQKTAPIQSIWIDTITDLSDIDDINTEFQNVADRVLRGNYGYYKWTLIIRNETRTTSALGNRTRYLAYVLIHDDIETEDSEATVITAIEANFNNDANDALQTSTKLSNPELRLFKRTPLTIESASEAVPTPGA